MAFILNTVSLRRQEGSKQHAGNPTLICQKYSELLSPARIYSYARKELGMVNAENIRTVKVDNSDIMVAQAVVYPIEEETDFLITSTL